MIMFYSNTHQSKRITATTCILHCHCNGVVVIAVPRSLQRRLHIQHISQNTSATLYQSLPRASVGIDHADLRIRLQQCLRGIAHRGSHLLNRVGLITA